jgi:hypothetical protein
MSKAIRAYAYLRKSTADPEEKSIGDQHTRVHELGHPSGARYEVVRVFADPATPGWKRGHRRPDYHRMVTFLSERRDGKVEAILVDDCDRYSRADSMDTISDINALRGLGIKWIHSGNSAQGFFDLSQDHDMGMVAMRLAMVANASHEVCLRGSRRASEGRRVGAEAREPKRTGGRAPYGMIAVIHADDVNDTGKKKGRKRDLKPGDAEEVKVLRWLFDQFVNHLRSMIWLAGDLNRRKVPSPRGGQWSPKSIGQLLRNRIYRGDYTYNVKPSGQFTRLDARGKVVQASDLQERGKVFVREGTYKSIISPDLFAAAQRRLSKLARDRSTRKRMGYCLTGVLVCDHCNSKMYGCRVHGGNSATVYRCGGQANRGTGSCGHRQVRESVILPFVARKLSEVLGRRVEELLTVPSADLLAPAEERRQAHSGKQRERDALARKIDAGVERILDVQDRLTRQALDKRITAMRHELAQLDLQLGAVREEPGYTPDELQALREWWQAYEDKAIAIPVRAHNLLTIHYRNYYDSGEEDNPQVLADPRATNEALMHLGCEVRLRWQTRQVPSAKSGRMVTKHELVRGRLKIDGQNSTIPARQVLAPSGTRRFPNLARKLLSGIDEVFDGADLQA